MDRERQNVNVGEYGFNLTLHVVRDNPWPDDVIAKARSIQDLRPGASDLEAVSRLLVYVFDLAVGELVGERSSSKFLDPDRAERN